MEFSWRNNVCHNGTPRVTPLDEWDVREADGIIKQTPQSFTTFDTLSILAKGARLQLFGKSPVVIYLRLRRIWQLLPSPRAQFLSYPRIRGVHAQLGLPPPHPPDVFGHVFSPKPSCARTRLGTHSNPLTHDGGECES